MVNDKMVNDSMELRIREVAQQLFFEQGYAATSTTQIAKEVGCTQAGRVAKIEAFDLMITIASLTVFTFVSLPMFQDLLSQSDDQVREYVAHRKSEIIRMVKKILKP